MAELTEGMCDSVIEHAKRGERYPLTANEMSQLAHLAIAARRAAPVDASAPGAVSEGASKNGVGALVIALREIRFAIQFASESLPVSGPLWMMHHPFSVLEFIDNILVNYGHAALAAPAVAPVAQGDEADLVLALERRYPLPSKLFDVGQDAVALTHKRDGYREGWHDRGRLVAPVAISQPAGIVTEVGEGFASIDLEGYVHVGDRVYTAPVAPKEAGPELNVDDLSNFIRRIDGNHTMGAGALAEHILEYLAFPCRAAIVAPAPPIGFISKGAIEQALMKGFGLSTYIQAGQATKEFPVAIYAAPTSEGNSQPAQQAEARDAARYRWMRHTFVDDELTWPNEVSDAGTSDELDAAVDAAMASQPADGSQGNG